MTGRRFRGVRRWSFRIAIAGVLALVALRLWPHAPLRDRFPQSIAVWSADGELLRVTRAADDQYRLWTPLASIAPVVADAFLLKEDRWFSWHPAPTEFELKHTWVTNAPLRVVVEKLRGFIADHHARIVSTADNALVLEVGDQSQAGLRRRADRTGRRPPTAVQLHLARGAARRGPDRVQPHDGRRRAGLSTPYTHRRN